MKFVSDAVDLFITKVQYKNDKNSYSSLNIKSVKYKSLNFFK